MTAADLDHDDDTHEPHGLGARLCVLAYGFFAYLCFCVVFGYFALFVGDLWVPRSVDRGPDSGALAALGVNALLVFAFALQHTVMARPSFKRWWTRWISPAVERSTYTLASSAILGAFMVLWRPLPAVVWEVSNPVAVGLLRASFTYGWLLLLWATFMIDHADLFGLRHVVLYWRQRRYSPLPFQVGAAYRHIRHPMMLGLIIAFWSTPRMTVGHLLFALLMTAYTLMGIAFEERTLSVELGEPYRRYRLRVPAFVPRLKSRAVEATRSPGVRKDGARRAAEERPL